MALNIYRSLTEFKAEMQISGTTHDAVIMDLLEQSSRWVDESGCQRHFYTETATRYFDGVGRNGIAWIDDFLSITTAKQDDSDNGVYDETITEDTDFWLYPNNSWPKVGIEEMPLPETSLRRRYRVLEVAGTFGYGDGTSDPWMATALTGTVATAGGTTLTVAASGVLNVGATIKIGTEQMFVSASSAGTATVTRGVNGTTAAAHSTAAISYASYPKPIVQAVQVLAKLAYLDRDKGGLQIFRIGEHTEQYMTDTQRMARINNLVAPYRRHV